MPARVARYEGRYGRLFADMTADWDQLQAGRPLEGALALTRATGDPFRADVLPQYFVGDLHAKLVLVHLNPMWHGEKWAQDRLLPQSFEDYVNAYRWFGRNHYGLSSPEWRSRFDRKMIRFLEPFGLMDFDAPAGDDRPVEQVKLERVIDQKLQLELIPYQSRSFDTRKLKKQAGALVEAHVERVLSVIGDAPRERVIFCGAIFDDLLAAHIQRRRPYETQLAKQDRTAMAQRSRFTAVELQTTNGIISAGIAQSWARQGLPMDSYARWIASLEQGPDAAVGAEVRRDAGARG